MTKCDFCPHSINKKGICVCPHSFCVLSQADVKEILKVDKFINHQVDPNLMLRIGEEFYNYFYKKNITKIITVESSGIAPAIITALKFNVPLVVMKKQTSSILNSDFYQAELKSFTSNSFCST